MSDDMELLGLQPECGWRWEPEWAIFRYMRRVLICGKCSTHMKVFK